MPITLFDSLTRETRELRRPDPQNPRDVFSFYNCGPTVYAPAHIGNFRTFVINDVLRRLLELEFGASHVKHVRNLTDVDDKTIRRAREEGRPLGAVTQQWTDKFHADCAALNCLPPNVEPTATGHIREQVDMIDVLMKKGNAYRAADGSVYFKVSSFGEYGHLSRVKERELQPGSALNNPPVLRIRGVNSISSGIYPPVVIDGVTVFTGSAGGAVGNDPLAILSKTGMDQGSVFVATCVAAAVSTMVMALYANYPIALAPGMGINAFFAFTVVLAYKYTWQQALAAVFCSGVLFFLISVFRIRQYVIESIPQNLKLAVSAGVGLFLGIIALEEAKVVVANPATLVSMGDLKNPVAALALLGFVLIVALNYRQVIGGTLIGILAVTAVGIPLGLAHYSGIVSLPPSIKPTLLQLDFSRVFEGTFLIVVFSILFIDVFDNAGTLIGVTHRTGLMKNGKLARMKEALISDSFAAMFGAAIGTSTTTSYIESAAGVSAGGRTGLTAAFVSIFFLLALLFAPLAGMIPAYATSAALLYVACVMARGLAEIDWEDITEYAPAVVTAITMPLTYSIATGIGLGFITYALVKLISGKVKDASPAVIVLAVLFAIKFAVSG